jgi:hypothetical protein
MSGLSYAEELELHLAEIRCKAKWLPKPIQEKYPGWPDHINPSGLLDFVLPNDAEEGIDMVVACEITRQYAIYDKKFEFFIRKNFLEEWLMLSGMSHLFEIL